MVQSQADVCRTLPEEAFLLAESSEEEAQAAIPSKQVNQAANCAPEADIWAHFKAQNVVQDEAPVEPMSEVCACTHWPGLAYVYNSNAGTCDNLAMILL